VLCIIDSLICIETLKRILTFAKLLLENIEVYTCKQTGIDFKSVQIQQRDCVMRKNLYTCLL